MKDITVSKFCIKFDACKSGRVRIYKQTTLKSKAMMSEIWPLLASLPSDLRWVATRNGVFSDCDLRLMACQFVRETPLADGRKVWDLLTDERLKNAVIVSEKFANNEASCEELAAARVAAGVAAGDAAGVAARAYQSHIIFSYGNPFLDGEK